MQTRATSERELGAGATATSAARRFHISLPLALALLCFLAGLLSRGQRLDDPDTMLHVVIGHWVLQHMAVPHVDFLTHSVPGTPWVAHEWLGGVVSALFYDAAGFEGLVTMASLGLAAALAIFVRALVRYYRPAQAVVIAVLAWIAIAPHWLARPHMVALPLMVWWMTLLVDAREERRAPPLWAALIMVLWVNLHGTFLVGIGFAGLCAVEAVLMTAGERARVQAAKDWILFTLASLAATLVTPNGIEAYLLPIRLLDMKFALSMLLEWKSIDFQHLSTLEIWLLLALGTMLWRGIRLPFVRVLMLLLLFAMSLQHARNGDLIAFIAPLLAAPWAGPQLQNRTAGSSDWLDRFARPSSAGGLVLAGVLALLAAGVAARFPLGPEPKYAPAAALAAAEAAHVTDGPVLNDYNFGDFLIFNGVKTFIDGRADMFGDPFIKRYYEAVHGRSDDLPALLEQYKIAWTIFPADARAVVLIDRLPGWRRLYADKTAVVQVREDAPR
ncbi:MAG TPA: hypothetical protein VLV50_04390 [Stellaceae bacterium]|nr:hypothetical protein [Stellaceae bacterium]